MDLTTSYLGLQLAHPLIASASPLSYDLDGIRRLEDGGAAAVVLHSLFEEQIRRPSGAPDYSLRNPLRAAEVPDYFPDGYNLDPEAYLNLIREAKAAVDIPIIGSLNGISPHGWTRYAQYIQEAGADALELNLYFIPTDPNETGEQVETRYFRVLRAVDEMVTLPLAVKVSPFFSSPANMAMRLGNAGADGLVLFNRFFQPDLDIESGDVTPTLTLTTSADLTLPLRWVAILYGRVPADLAVTSGVHTYQDVLKAIMVGAKVTTMASEALANGVERFGAIRDDLIRWLEAHQRPALKQLVGVSSHLKIADSEAFERANYTKSLQSWMRRRSS